MQRTELDDWMDWLKETVDWLYREVTLGPQEVQ